MKKLILPIAMILVIVLLSIFVTAKMTAINFPGLSDNGFSVEVRVTQGWNIVPSIYLSEDEISSDSEITKNDISVMWYYSPNKNKYYQLLPNFDEEIEGGNVVSSPDIIRGSSVWIYSKKEGILKYKKFISDYSFINQPSLFKGWNFIVFTPNMVGKSLWENKGSCNIEKVYGYGNDRGTSNWVEGDQFNRLNSPEVAGFSIVVKVSEDCKWGSSASSSNGGTTNPPGLPLDINTPVDNSYPCTETDGGLNYNKKGAVYYGKYDYVDSCGNPGTVNAGTPQEYTIVEGDLMEHSCYGSDNDKRCTEGACRFIKYHCPNGCSNGACINI